MSKRINLLSTASASGGVGVGVMTSAGNPWTVTDDLANDLVNRKLATYADVQPLGLVPVSADPLTGSLLKPDGAPVSGAGISKVVFSASGSLASPISPIPLNISSGKYGLPAPYIKFDANTLQVGEEIEIGVTHVRGDGSTAQLAPIFLSATLGSTNGAADASLGSVTLTNSGIGNPNRAEVTWKISISATKAESFCKGFVENVGTKQAFAEVTLDRTVDNYVSIVFSGVASKLLTGTLVAGGTGYTVADTLTAVGGTGTAATLTVTSVSVGVVTGFSVATGGNYSAAPGTNAYAGDSLTVTGGTGTGFTFKPTFNSDAHYIVSADVVRKTPVLITAMVNQVASPITVPRSFFGLNSQDWPATAGTAPTLSYGTFSTLDQKKVHWGKLQTGAGALSANISDMDTVVNTAWAAGQSVNYAFYGCPAAFASTGAGVAGAYGGLGEGAFPNDLTQVTYFLTALINRYNTSTVKKITSIQLWNEPSFTQATGGTAFWGTPGQFVDLLWTAYQAIKAADPSIVVLTPGTYRVYTSSANDGAMDQWINVAGTVNTTRRGYDCFDAVAAHPYHARPAGQLYSGFGDMTGLSLGGILPFRTLLRPYGKANVDYYVTEYGVSSGADPELATFLVQTAAYRKAFISRLVVDALLAGVKLFSIWSYGNLQKLCGDLTNDTTGVIAGWNEVYAACVGKTISSGGYMPDGSRALVFSDGTTYTV